MRLKLLIHLTVVTTALFFNAKISLAETIKVPYVSISGFQAPLWLGEKAGAFRKNQLEVQLIYMPGGSLIVQTRSRVRWGSPVWLHLLRSALGRREPSWFWSRAVSNGLSTS